MIGKLINYASNLFATNEPTGFQNLAKDSEISFADIGRVFTIQPKNATIPFIINQKAVTTHIKESQNIVISDDEGLHFIYYDEGVLYSKVTPTYVEIEDIIVNKVITAIVYWDFDNQESIFFANERHGSMMPSIIHKYLHEKFGTSFLSGAAIENITSEGTGSLNSHAQFGLSLGTAMDEDITFTADSVGFLNGLPIYYKLGAAGNIRRSYNPGFSILNTGTGRLAYNIYDVDQWKVLEVPNADFALYHIFLTNNISEPYIAVMGENYYPNVGAARDGATTEISYLVKEGVPFQEFVPVATVIYQTRDNYTNDVKSRIRSIDGLDFVDWRYSGLSPAHGPSSHDNLSGLLNDTHLQYALSNAMSTGLLFRPTLVDNANGTLTLGSSVANLFPSTDYTGRIHPYTIPSATLTLVDGGVSHIVVDYSDGTPIYSVISNVDLIGESAVIPVLTCSRFGNDIVNISWDALGIGLVNKIHAWIVKTRRFSRQYGLDISVQNVREVQVSAGKSYHGVTPVIHGIVNSVTDTFCHWYHVGGVWTKNETVTQFSNAQYDDGTDLQTLLPNKFVNNWIYRSGSEQAKVCLVLGESYGSLALANTEKEPSRPPQIAALGILVGKIVAKAGTDTQVVILSAFDNDFTGGSSVFVSQNNVIDDTTTARTLTIDDSKKYIRHDNISPITLTVPLNSSEAHEIGTETDFEQTGTGVITFVGVVGVTINSYGDAYTSMGQFTTMSLKKVAINTWTLSGMVT